MPFRDIPLPKVFFDVLPQNRYVKLYMYICTVGCATVLQLEFGCPFLNEIIFIYLYIKYIDI